MKRFIPKRRLNINWIPIIIIIIISVLLLLKVIGKKMEPGLNNYAVKEATKLITIVVRSSINDKLIKEIDTNSLYITSNNSIDINSVILNEYLDKVTISIQNKLKYLEEGNIEALDIDNVLASYDLDNLKKGIYAMMPIGVVFNNPLLINLSPKIPLKLYFLGNAKTKVVSKVTPYGINNALIELILHVEVNAQILMPIRSKDVCVKLDFPIINRITEGKVPSYLGGFR